MSTREGGGKGVQGKEAKLMGGKVREKEGGKREGEGKENKSVSSSRKKMSENEGGGRRGKNRIIII